MSIHPEILSLQRLKDQAREQVQKGQLEELLETLWCWNIELKEVDQKKDLIEEIEKERKTLLNFSFAGAKNRRIKKMVNIYKGWYSETMKLTWEKGYFENKKYAPETKRDTLFKGKKKWNEE